MSAQRVLVCCFRFGSFSNGDEASSRFRHIGGSAERGSKIRRYDLNDHEWAAIKPMLPNKPRGAPRVMLPVTMLVSVALSATAIWNVRTPARRLRNTTRSARGSTMCPHHAMLCTSFCASRISVRSCFRSSIAALV
jgi:hypothetical protein